ncbi:DUF4097 family beta strand repeat protein [Streptomyces seoulensis]|nr:DUF4097 family beta strand repeat protein [Streptomyces seoulensis]
MPNGEILMHQRLRLLAAASVTVIAAGALGACGVISDDHFKDDHSVSDRITSIRLDNKDGGVEIRGDSDTTKVSVHREVGYRGDKPDSPSFRVDDGVLVLAGCGDDCSIDYTVDVPAGLPVTGTTSNGAIDLSGVGAVQVGTSNGDVTVDGADGAVDLHTSNGRIKAKGLKGGGVKAKSSNGPVVIGTAAAQNVWVRTSNAPVTVTAAAGPYRVTAHTSNGSPHVSVPTDPKARYALDLGTSTGDITVKAP